MKLTETRDGNLQDLAAGKIVEFPYRCIDEKCSETLVRFLRSVLREVRKEDISTELVYILQELIDNANKANFKRVYFHDKNLDILNPVFYRKEINGFVKTIHANLEDCDKLFQKWNCSRR